MGLALENKTEFENTDWLAHIQKIHNTKSLKELADTFTESRVFTAAIGQSIPPLGSNERQNSSRFFYNKMPKPALDYIKKHYSQKIDPVAKYVLDHGRAIWLSDLAKEKTFIDSGYDKVINQMLNLIGDGISVPSFHQSHWGYSFVSVGKQKQECSEVLLLQVESLCQHTHLRYVVLMKLFQNQVNLTNRELDVIELVAMGKTNAEIALILDITTHTVAGHIKKIYLKLNTTDRVTAALRAMSLNLIS